MSLLSFRKTGRKPGGVSSEDRKNSVVDAEDEGVLNDQKKQSKRDYLKSFLKRPSIDSSAPSTPRTVSTHTSDLAEPVSPSTKTTPLDPNKPLPPPPQQSSPTPFLTTGGTISGEPLKVERIITPIIEADLFELFSGAPHFLSQSLDPGPNIPCPSVAFPYNTQSEARDISDHHEIQEDAWKCATLLPRISQEVDKAVDTSSEASTPRRCYLPNARERPYVPSTLGIERGTIGFQAALEMAIADVFKIPEEDDDEISSDGFIKSISVRRGKFMCKNDGLRPITQSTLVQRLESISLVYHEDTMTYGRPDIELYTELFTQILFPPSRVTDPEDPYSLQVQIQALLTVLDAPNVWVDFSIVEWRIRLGQILWAPSPDSDFGAQENMDKDSLKRDHSLEKFWVLVQILLSCELLLRLNALCVQLDLEADAMQQLDFSSLENPRIQWSLLLARTWLENICVEQLSSENKNEEKKETESEGGWLSTFVPSPTSVKDKTEEDLVYNCINNTKFSGRNQHRQVTGLLRFAEDLRWPGIEELSILLTPSHLTPLAAENSKLITNPSSLKNPQHTQPYFGAKHQFLDHRKKNLRPHKISAAVESPGWLSKTYFNGLILPGECLTLLLMSTLLQNDIAAISVLGDEADLYGGFVYSDRSFWNVTSIVGRVLAAGQDALECMGWVSSTITPRGFSKGWVEIEVDVLIDEVKRQNTARVWHGNRIEHDGHILGGADPGSVLLGDFATPINNMYGSGTTIRNLAVSFEYLDLLEVNDSNSSSPDMGEDNSWTDRKAQNLDVGQYTAIMSFIVKEEENEARQMDFALGCDVFFVTAHPCVPPDSSDMIKSPISSISPVSDKTDLAISPSTQSTGHPLHKAFAFTRIALAEIIHISPATSLREIINSPKYIVSGASSSHTTNSKIPRVLVIDCDFKDLGQEKVTKQISTNQAKSLKHCVGNDMEMLARALCAERGWNAVVSRRGRGCLSCAVREVGALGWSVILRLG